MKGKLGVGRLHKPVAIGEFLMIIWAKRYRPNEFERRAE
jgi:hypothetical protein